MPRSVTEWRGKTDDSRPPPRVRVRVFEAHGGRCYLTGAKILPGDKWQLDHMVALINGGENVESNLAPVLDAPHKAKTKADVAEKSRVASVKAKHIGAVKPKGSIPRPPKAPRSTTKTDQLRAMRERQYEERQR